MLTLLRNQEPVYVSEFLQSLLTAYSKAGLLTGELCQDLESRLDIIHSICIFPTLVSLKRDQIGGQAIAKQNLTNLRSFARALVANKSFYNCQSPDFKVKKVIWHCPSCKNWATIKPIFGLEGESCIVMSNLPFLGEALRLQLSWLLK